VLETRRSLDDEKPAFAPGGDNEHAAGCCSDDSLAGVRRNLAV